MVSTEIENPDISIPSDQFLAEVRKEKQNFAIEALKADQRQCAVAVKTQRHAVQGVLEEAGSGHCPLPHKRDYDSGGSGRLFRLAKDIRAARGPGEQWR